MLEIIVSICICGMIFSVCMLIRNEQTFRERMKIHAAIFKKDKNDNFTNTDRIGELLTKRDSIASYNKILHTFWKRPNSFYKEFLEELEKQNQEREAFNEELLNVRDGSEKEKKVIENKKKGYTSRMIKAAALMEGEK